MTRQPHPKHLSRSEGRIVADVVAARDAFRGKAKGIGDARAKVGGVVHGKGMPHERR